MIGAEDIKRKYDLKGTPTLGLIAATFGFFVGFASVATYGPAAAAFKKAMELSGIFLGLLVAAPQLTGSLLRIPFGAWADKVGGKKPMLTLLILACIGMAGLATILYIYYPDKLTIKLYPIIFILGLLSGCGVATYSVGVPQTSYWFPKNKQGWALGIYAGLGNTAAGWFTFLLPTAIAAWGLTTAYSIWFAFLLIGTAVYAWIAYDAYYFQLINWGIPRDEAERVAKALGQELIPSGSLIKALKVSAKIPSTWALVILYFTSFGGFLALTTWFPAYWGLFYDLNPKTAGMLTAVAFSLLASFIRVYGGHASDKNGGEKVAIVSFTLVFIGAVVLIFSRSFFLSLIGSILIGAGMGMGNAAVFKLIAKYVPGAVGSAGGWVGGLGAFGGFVIPPILGTFVDMFGKVGYAYGFIIYAVLAIVCIGISFLLKSRYGHQLH
ncbi:MAG: MFS transporter [Hydrogenobacter thermophilus]|uniref:MFS transporter n=1 Tax=Hydrogenobacter thermophilus TaxID=940 RepID=UPI001C75F8AF|nr:MFS transporter [Hydrogenobacter thermophilus]QWK19217.1 MAG: MFS transporter [Hydrogenobacter thermophilus]